MLYRAAHVLPVLGPAIADGAVLVEGETIVAVGRAESLIPRAGGEVEDLGRAALLPGLVNAHCHLELTALSGKIEPGLPFVDWVRRVIAIKMQTPAESFATAAVEGARRLLAAGTTTVADIVSTDGVVEALAEVPIRKVIFREVLGIGRKAEAAIAGARAFAAGAAPSAGTTFGLSPHAPYSTAPEVYRECATLAKKHGLPLTTHLAETTEEIEFLELGAGPFRTLLDEMNLLPEDFRPPRRAPLDFLAAAGGLGERTLLAHMNHPASADPVRMAEVGASVAYCPGTHGYFGRGRHPFREFLDAGVNVCLGTDSAASNPTLSVLDEMRTVFRANRSLWPLVILKMATINGAAALGLGESVGALVPGFCADMIAVPLKPGGPADPLENVLASDARPNWVMTAGRVIAGAATAAR